jgi:hypothetical protein
VADRIGEQCEIGVVRDNKVVYVDRDSVKDRDLHDAYLDVWAAMAGAQFPPP